MITRGGVGWVREEEVGVTRVTVQLSSGELREVNEHLDTFKYINTIETKYRRKSCGIH